MAYFNTSTADVKIEFQKTQPKPGVNETDQSSMAEQEDGIYQQPADFQLNDGRIENKQIQQNNWLLKCFMAMVIVLTVTVFVLAVSILKQLLQACFERA